MPIAYALDTKFGSYEDGYCTMSTADGVYYEIFFYDANGNFMYDSNYHVMLQDTAIYVAYPGGTDKEWIGTVGEVPSWFTGKYWRF